MLLAKLRFWHLLMSRSTALKAFGVIDQVLSSLWQEKIVPPGTPPEVNFGRFFFPPVLNNSAHIPFRGEVYGPGVTTSNGNGVWLDTGSNLSLIARAGQAAPGTSANYSSMSAPLINASGKYVFFAYLDGGRFDPPNNHGIWSNRSGSLDVIVQTGVSAPGTSAGVIFSSIGSPAFNTSGQTAFRSLIAGRTLNQFNDSGIWSEGSGDLALVAREGAQAPEYPLMLFLLTSERLSQSRAE